MLEMKNEFLEKVESGQTREDKQRILIGEVKRCLEIEVCLTSEMLETIEMTWQTLGEEAIAAGENTLVQLVNEYRQAIRNFNKQKERVVAEVAGQKQKEVILEEIEKMKEAEDWRNLAGALRRYKEKWEDSGYAGKEEEPKLNAKFAEEYNSLMESKDAYFDNMQTALGNAKEKKEKLVKKAKEAAQSSLWKETSKEMRELMDAWRETGNAGRDYNDVLWEEFNDARQSFFTRQDEYFVEMREKQAKSLEIKKELVEEAKSINRNEGFKETAEAMRNLMERWKAAGSAGREHEDTLWNEFSEARKVFYERQDEFYKQKQGQFAEKLYDGIKRKNKQLADLDVIMKDLESRVQELQAMEQVPGNQDNRWEIMNQRNQEIVQYKEHLKTHYQKAEELKDQLKEMNGKYEKFAD